MGLIHLLVIFPISKELPENISIHPRKQGELHLSCGQFCSQMFCLNFVCFLCAITREHSVCLRLRIPMMIPK